MLPSKCRSSLFRVKNDIQVSVEDAEFLKKGCPAAELLLIDKMNHVLKDCESKAVQQQMLTYGNPSLPVNSTLIASVSTFVKKSEMIWENKETFAVEMPCV